MTGNGSKLAATTGPAVKSKWRWQGPGMIYLMLEVVKGEAGWVTFTITSYDITNNKVRLVEPGERKGLPMWCDRDVQVACRGGTKQWRLEADAFANLEIRGVIVKFEPKP